MKTLQAIVLTLALAATGAAAQVTGDESKPTAKGAQPPKPADANKAPAPKKGVAPTKAGAGKKAEAPKKAAAKKAEPAKAQAPKKAPAPVATGNPNARVYKAGDPDVPTLRDKDGKTIPTSPGAYDVSSAKK